MHAIQVLSTSSMAHSLEISAAESGQRIFHIDLSNVHSKSALIEAIGVGLNLPDYFGRNFDALEECLRDLKEDKGWLLIFENADDLLRVPSSELSTFVSILADTVEFWKSEGHSFRAVFIGGPTLASAVGSSPTPA